MRTKTKPEVREISIDSSSHEVEVVALEVTSKGTVKVTLSSRPYKGGWPTYTVGSPAIFDTDLIQEVPLDEASDIAIGMRYRVHIEPIAA